MVTKTGKGKNLLPLLWFMKEIKSVNNVYLNASCGVIEEDGDDVLKKYRRACGICGFKARRVILRITSYEGHKTQLI